MRRRSDTSNRPMAEAMTTAAKRGVWQMLEQRGRKQQQQRDGERAHDAGQLRPGARRLGDRCARRAAADREALKEGGGEVGDAEAHHLLVRIDRCAQTRRVGSREHARVGERDERDREATREDRARSSTWTSGRRGEGSPCGRGPSTDMPARAREVESGDHDGRGDHGDQNARHARPALQQQDQRERAGADRERHDVRASRRAPLRRCPTTWRSGPSRSTENPKSFGSWLSSTVSAMPFM